MFLYIVIESNGAEYAEDYSEQVGGVYSSLEAAKAHEVRYETEVERIEQWELDGVCVDGDVEDEEGE